MIALLTRYHRRASPKHEHIGMTELDKKARTTVGVLSAFLRLAETLDRSRHGVIRGIEVRERLNVIHIKVQAVGDAELEVWAAHKQASALEDALDRKVRIEKVPYRKASAPSVAMATNTAAVNSELARTKPTAASSSRSLQGRQPNRRSLDH